MSYRDYKTHQFCNVGLQFFLVFLHIIFLHENTTVLHKQIYEGVRAYTLSQSGKKPLHLILNQLILDMDTQNGLDFHKNNSR